MCHPLSRRIFWNIEANTKTPLFIYRHRIGFQLQAGTVLNLAGTNIVVTAVPGANDDVTFKLARGEGQNRVEAGVVQGKDFTGHIA